MRVIARRSFWCTRCVHRPPSAAKAGHVCSAGGTHSTSAHDLTQLDTQFTLYAERHPEEEH